MKFFLIQLVFISSLFSMGLPSEYYEIKPIKGMKQYFFNHIAKLVNKQNDIILDDRKFLKSFFKNKDLETKNIKDYKRFKLIQKRYKFKDSDTLETYLKHIDIIPTSIVLSQAAIESGWGKSRFSKEANNLFGQWTWSGRGLVPKGRDAGLKHKIKIFDSLEGSVKGYLININLGHAYVALRDKREMLRKEHNKISGLALVDTLINYSQKRKVYTDMLEHMIKKENLQRFEQYDN